jgi:UDP:flavonoid glycosyltransferase YjiC (YdhE family)
MKECHVPARIVLATAGSFGDLFPTLGLGIELLRRGHTPVIATSAHYRALIEAQGLEFRAIRPDLNPFDPEILAKAMDPYRGSEVVVRDLVVPSVRESYADFLEALKGADLVVSHPITFAVPLAAEALGLPWLSSVLAPLSFFSAHDFPALPPVTGLARIARLHPALARGILGLSRLATRSWVRPVHDLRRELGLSPGGHPLFEGQFSPYGTLAMFSRVMGEPQVDWPPNTTVTGFVFYDTHGAMPDELVRFLASGDAPIVFTGGSTAVGAASADAFYTASAAAAHALGRRAVLMVSANDVPRVSARLPASMIAVAFAPHHVLFPRAAVVVHHGGVGTTGQALRAGRPALVVPHAHDQPDNALRAERAGAAGVLDARRYTAARAAEALRPLLDDPRYTRGAQEAAARIGQERGAENAAQAIERAITATQ